MNTGTNTTIAPRSAWEMIAYFAAMVAAGATLHSFEPLLSLAFLALSLLIGATAFRLAIREGNRLPALVSAIATTAMVAFLIQAQWPAPGYTIPAFPTITIPAAIIIIVSPILLILAGFLWYFFYRRARPYYDLTRAPYPLTGNRFVGRRKEEKALDDAWEGVIDKRAITNASPTREMATVAIIARGGFGKTTLVRCWLWHRFEEPNRPRLPLPGAVFWHTFRKATTPTSSPPPCSVTSPGASRDCPISPRTTPGAWRPCGTPSRASPITPA